MEKLKLSRGFSPTLTGHPDLSTTRRPFPSTIGCAAGDIPFIRPKLLVKEGERVKTGAPLFTDKRDLTIQYVAPATGRVKKILFGERRRLLEVIIEPEPTDEFVQFDPVSENDLDRVERPQLVDHLKQGGLWQGLRQFPAKDTADPAHTPSMIIISLNGNDIFSPHPAVVLKENMDAFLTGMELLKRFSHRLIVTARQDSLKKLKQLTPDMENIITHVTQDTYPAWNPGAVLYNIKETKAENTSWCISLDHLVMMGQFLMTGRYPVEKIITASRNDHHRPHIRIRQGAPVNTLTAPADGGGMITTGRFNGRILDPTAHLGFFENTLNIIDGSPEDEMFGFVRPGLDKATVSSTFLSSVFRKPAKPDCTLHGELRACINCSYCERICPNDLMPNFIMKALHADEIEEALSLGLMDCCQCGLCSYTCPSKIELTKILADGINSHYKDSQYKDSE